MPQFLLQDASATRLALVAQILLEIEADIEVRDYEGMIYSITVYGMFIL